MADSKLIEMIRQSLESIGEIVNAETVMGKPINTPQGTTIIPVSKVSVGYASGGVDYFGKNIPAPDKNTPDKLSSFGGGGGTGITLSPVGFLVINADGSTELLSFEATNNINTAVSIVNTVVDFAERSPELVGKIKNIFSGDKKKEEPAADETTPAEVTDGTAE